MKRYTSEQIKEAEDLYNLQDSFCCFGIPFRYQMTKGEIKWFRMVRNRYSIADFIEANTDGNFCLTFDDPESLTRALEEDDMSPKAVMLSDDTALQKLFFWLS